MKPIIAFQPDLATLFIPSQIPEKAEAKPFQTSDHFLLIASRMSLIQSRIPPKIFLPVLLIPFQTSPTKLLIAFHVVLQTLDMLFRIGKITDSRAFIPADTTFLIVFQTVEITVPQNSTSRCQSLVIDFNPTEISD